MRAVAPRIKTASFLQGALFLLFFLAGCGEATQEAAEVPAAGPDPASVAKLVDDSPGDDWPAFGRTYGEQHYSPLTQINTGNVSDLGLSWYLDLPTGNTVTGPIEVDGSLYFAMAYSLVHAVDVATGKIKWVFDAGAAEASGRKLRQGWGSRGIAWWNGKVYTGTQDGRLVAIDAETGQQVWSVQTTDPDDFRFISGAPRVFDGKIIIGHGGADAANVRGYVTAYDAETGEQLWRFYTVPGNPADGFEDDTQRMAAETWSGAWWTYGGGGTVWNAITYDAELDQIYIGTGNGAPWNHRIRSNGEGDNLFLSSIVALDAKTGAYKWHYQTNPGETWDYNAAMDMQVAALEIDGTPRKVLMTAPKNGFFYVLDRVTGKVISAENIVPVSWASGINLQTGRPKEVPGARFEDGGSFDMRPGAYGAHNWLPMAYHPGLQLVFIPAIDMANRMSSEGIVEEGWQRTPENALDSGVMVSFPLDGGGKSSLLAWDPVTQTERWRVETPGFFNGGAVTTAGGWVLQGEIDGDINIYDGETGKLLWTFDAQAPAVAPPITYKVGDTQYITLLTGMGTSGSYLGPLLEEFGLNPADQLRRVLTFALDAKGGLPPLEKKVLVPVQDDGFVPDPAAEARGEAVYGQYCAICHGFRAIGVGTASDLRASSLILSSSEFNTVVNDGALVSGGMPQFDELSAAQREDIRQYLRREANTLRAGEVSQ